MDVELTKCATSTSGDRSVKIDIDLLLKKLGITINNALLQALVLERKSRVSRKVLE